jgi:hypothetical protein
LFNSFFIFSIPKPIVSKKIFLQIGQVLGIGSFLLQFGQISVFCDLLIASGVLQLLHLIIVLQSGQTKAFAKFLLFKNIMDFCVKCFCIKGEMCVCFSDFLVVFLWSIICVSMFLLFSLVKIWFWFFNFK